MAQKLTGLPVAEVRSFEAIGSTNDEALLWAVGGASDGSMVIAESQTHGRGRLNRRWITQPGAALAFSIVLKTTKKETERLTLFSPLGALAICQAFEEELGLQPTIKWPNDILLRGKKVAGILVEAAWLGEHLQGVVIGIGLNVKPSAIPPDDQTLFPATSVEQVLMQPVDRFDLLRAILEALFGWRSRLTTRQFFEGWEKRLAFRNEWVKLSEDGEHTPIGETTGRKSLTGQLLGLDSSGSLKLRLESGEIRSVAVGDVHLRPLWEK